MPFGHDDREFARPAALPNWLREFADKELKKDGTPFEDIKNLFLNKKNLDAVESRVQELCEQIGLNKIQKQAKNKDELRGGLGDNYPDERYDSNQLEKGIKVELEHTDDPKKAKEITKDHLEESKDFKGGTGAKYYNKLEDMEDKIEDELSSKAQLLQDLIVLANRYEDSKNTRAAKAIDRTIKRLSEMLAKDKSESIFEKHPKIQRMIDEVCLSRGGYIDAPAIMQMLQGEKFKDVKLSDENKSEIKKYVKDKIKEEKKMVEDPDDVSGMSYVVFVVNEDDGNTEVFDKPTR